MKAGRPTDKFGEFIITKLRDEAIDFYDGLAKEHWKSPSTQKLQTELSKFTEKQRRCVFAAVDYGLHNFLFGLGEANDFDQGIAVVVDGKNVAEQSDGLEGEPCGKNGWIAKYGKHPESED
jgi:hypothetical protein